MKDPSDESTSDDIEQKLNEEQRVIYERVFQQAFFEYGTIVPEGEKFNHYISLYGELKESMEDTHIIPIGVAAPPPQNDISLPTDHKTRVQWTSAENQLLRQLKEEDPNYTWEQIAVILSKNAKQCCYQWHRVCAVNKKGRWSKYEDAQLRKQWPTGNVSIPDRSSVQIKLRARRLGLK